MTDFDLESKLKGVPAPERSPAYWENFPVRVRVNLRRAPVEFAPRRSRPPRLAWGISFALLCVIFCLAAWPAIQAVVRNEKMFRRELAQFPDHLRVLMQNDHGMHYLVADQP